jgi:hypothetical protein
MKELLTSDHTPHGHPLPKTPKIVLRNHEDHEELHDAKLAEIIICELFNCNHEVALLGVLFTLLSYTGNYLDRRGLK